MTAQRLESRGASIRGALARVPFIVMVILVLGAGAVTVLLLNTRTAEIGVQVQDLGEQADSLQRDNDSLARAVALLDSTQVIARRATELGLVQPDASTIVDCRKDPCTIVPGTDPTAATSGAGR